MSRVFINNHPVVQHKLTILRDKNTGSKEFRELTSEIAQFLTYEFTRDLKTQDVEIDTPLSKMKGCYINLKDIVVVPILRAGTVLAEGILKLLPTAKVGHVGVYRDHQTLKPITYYVKTPPIINDSLFIVVDPMLATGGSAIEAIRLIKERGARKISFVCILAAPEGIKNLHKAHPGVDIYTASVDDCLDERGYILPGLGDAGDRLFGTK
ncbi:MAG: Uracil phosphoribosyltransferase [candidate division WS2 bacterium]|uniref:Uracil phosphoribosyltransferase n=1 Tax=Psychracetigena formicireducens TaxID=2986056 RepID=A0A9E2BJS1_PSYF1|nr:Uracil phosphoribosyltransferase [Candidatus Psychracetigena formicireducens]MBT9144384.1 Uracil phosphoribosyltransferase [Candidatus Psychracetigena formicireducens]MBT9149896.1 Uracil phosphoribosyltransferase [Candidatus Psychracetigena formicireducens]